MTFNASHKHCARFRVLNEVLYAITACNRAGAAQKVVTAILVHLVLCELNEHGFYPVLAVWLLYHHAADLRCGIKKDAQG